MQLRITLRLLTGDHLIGCISEEALQAAKGAYVVIKDENPDVVFGR